MNRLYIVFLLLIVLIVFFIPKGSYGLGLEIAGGFWDQHPSGDIKYRAISETDKLDLEQDLKYDDKYRPYGRIKAELPLMLPNIYVMVTPMKFEGRGSKDVNFKFGDRIFISNQPFDSMIKLDHYDITLFYSLPFLETMTLGKLSGEIGLDARIIDFEAQVTQEASGLSESESISAILPMLYVGIQVKLVDMISVEGEARGIAYNSNHFYDLIGRVKIKLVAPLFIAAGYRYENIKFDESDVQASVKFEGPFVETGLHF